MRRFLSAMGIFGSLIAGLATGPVDAGIISEPPVFTSKGGVLDLLMVATPAPMYGLTTPGYYPTAWAYLVCPRPVTGLWCPPGTAAPYGGVRLALQQGDSLRIRLVNNLPAIDPVGLTRGNDDPLLKLNPTNLHTHGLIVDAKANTAIPPAIPTYGDFVFTAVFNPKNGDPALVDPGMYQILHAHGDVVKTGVVDYRIDIPWNHPNGAFWFHPHMHGISVNQISAGLSGIISVGKTAAYLCGDLKCSIPIPENMVRHLILKDMQVLAGPNGGTPQYQSDPGFCPGDPAPGEPDRNGSCPADLAAYPQGGKWIFTLNGDQFPWIPMATSDGEIWRLQNAAASTSYALSLVDDASGRKIPVQLLSMDGVSINVPTGTKAGDIVKLGGARFTYAPCSSSDPNNPYTVSTKSLQNSIFKPGEAIAAPVCVTDLYMMPSNRAEIWASYRNAKGDPAAVSTWTSATFKMAHYNTGPIGDDWPAVNLAKVLFKPGPRFLVGRRLLVRGDAMQDMKPGGILVTRRTDLPTQALTANCAPLQSGHRRRVYFGNPGTGSDADDNAIFGLGTEEIDQNGVPVPGTFHDVSRFNPEQVVCLPLGPGNAPAVETWELINLTGELHNFHIHQTKFRVISATAPAGTVLASNSAVGAGIEEDTIPLPYTQPVAPFALPDSGSCSVDDFKAGRCLSSPIVVQIPFSRVGQFVFHCHILEHEDGGMMHSIRVVPSPY